MIILVFGLPGSGKTTIAEQLTEKLGGAVYIGTDKIRQKLEKSGHYDASAKQQIYEALFKELHEVAGKHHTIIIDGTFYKKVYRERIKSIAKAYRQRFVMIEIKAAAESIENRMDQKRKYSEADYKVYETIKLIFEDAEEPHLILYSDQSDVQGSVEKAMDYLMELL